MKNQFSVDYVGVVFDKHVSTQEMFLFDVTVAGDDYPSISLYLDKNGTIVRASKNYFKFFEGHIEFQKELEKAAQEKLKEVLQ